MRFFTLEKRNVSLRNVERVGGQGGDIDEALVRNKYFGFAVVFGHPIGRPKNRIRIAEIGYHRVHVHRSEASSFAVLQSVDAFLERDDKTVILTNETAEDGWSTEQFSATILTCRTSRRR